MWFVRVPGLKVVAPATAYDAKGLIQIGHPRHDPVLFFEHRRSTAASKRTCPPGSNTGPSAQAKVVREGQT